MIPMVYAGIFNMLLMAIIGFSLTSIYYIEGLLRRIPMLVLKQMTLKDVFSITYIESCAFFRLIGWFCGLWYILIMIAKLLGY